MKVVDIISEESTEQHKKMKIGTDYAKAGTDVSKNALFAYNEETKKLVFLGNDEDLLSESIELQGLDKKEFQGGLLGLPVFDIVEALSYFTTNYPRPNWYNTEENAWYEYDQQKQQWVKCENQTH